MGGFVECAAERELERERERVKTAVGLAFVESGRLVLRQSRKEREIPAFVGGQGPLPCSSSLEGMMSKVAG